MAHVDDLTLLGAAQLLASDNLYVGRPGDPDPDARTRLEYLAEYLGGSPDLIAALKTALPIEQGTFTPILRSSSTQPTVTHSSQTGLYYRVANLIAFVLYVQTTARTGGTGNIRLGGLPFTFPSTIPFACRPNNITYSGQVVARSISNSDQFSLDNIASAAGPSELPITAWPNSAAVQVSGAFYITP